jgi:hypothetical protein
MPRWRVVSGLEPYGHECHRFKGYGECPGEAALRPNSDLDVIHLVGGDQSGTSQLTRTELGSRTVTAEPMVMRTLLTLLAVVGIGVLTAGAYARSPKDPTLRSRPGDVALAKSLLLGKADLPADFRDTGPDHSGSGPNVDCNGVVQPDLHRLVMTADVTSHDFERTDPLSGFTQLSTEATLFVNAAEAQASIAWLIALPKAKLQSCFAAAVRAGLPKATKTAGFHLTTLRRSIGQLRLYVWEVQLRFERSGTWTPIDFVMAGYHRGRALEMLMIVNAGGGLDPAFVTNLSRTLTARLTHATL